MDDDMSDGGASAGIKDKLIATKQRWAQERRLLTGRPSHREEDRLPPGQRKTTDWPVLDLGVKPNIPLDRWRLQVDGLVEQPMRLDWAAFQALPQADFTSDIHCVTAWSKLDNTWDGVLFSEVAKRAGVKAEATHALVKAPYDYDANLPIDALMDDDVLFAWNHDGEPLEPKHGGPLRLVVPKRYFWKSTKWANEVEFLDHDQRGFWEVRGYHNDAFPFEEQRYSWQE